VCSQTSRRFAPAALFPSQPMTMSPWSAFDIAIVVAIALILLVVFAV
jgi:hypothetical protein